MTAKITVWDLQNQARALLPEKRIKICKRAKRPGKEAAIASDRYVNLMRCGNAWVCPFCAALQAWAVAHNLAKAIREWEAEGGHVCMVTYTTQHNLHDNLAVTLGRLKKAFRASKSGRRYQSLKQAWEIAHSVGSWEIKYSDKSGFHPHIHELLFVRKPPNEDLFFDIEEDWLKRVPGLEGIAVVGILADEEIAAYVAKFGRLPKAQKDKPGLPDLAYEVALRHTKDRGGGYHDRPTCQKHQPKAVC